MADEELDGILASLKPICYAAEGSLTDGARAHFRNKDELIAILRKAVPTLDEFYTATRDKPQSKRIAHADGKVTL